MCEIEKHYFSIQLGRVVSLEEIVHRYINDGPAWMAETFEVYLDRKNYLPLETACFYIRSQCEDFVYMWTKECEANHIDTESVDGIEQWYDYYDSLYKYWKDCVKALKWFIALGGHILPGSRKE